MSAIITTLLSMSKNEVHVVSANCYKRKDMRGKWENELSEHTYSQSEIQQINIFEFENAN